MRLRLLTTYLRHHATLVNVLRLCWSCLIIWFEIGSFFWSVSDCRWPDSPWLKENRRARPTHILLVADSQVMDERSFPRVPTWIRPFARFVVENNLRKSWNVLSRFKPHVVIFLGDMINGGRYARTLQEYETFAKRFKLTFPIPKGAQAYYVVGNHDVGLGKSKSFSTKARDRYRQTFGELNQHLRVSNHSLVLLDAPAIVEEDYRRVGEGKTFKEWVPTKGGPIEFVEKVATEGLSDPLILFSHIPLARPELAPCGPLRESGSIHRGAGSGYQNLLGRGTTRFLLEETKPTLIFSADDHDYCDYTHTYALGKVREVTVKSISMVSGVSRPGFHLLSLYNPTPTTSPTYMDKPCLLPNQIGIYTHGYLFLLVLTTGLLVYMNLQISSRRPKPLLRPEPNSANATPRLGYPSSPRLRTPIRRDSSRPTSPLLSPVLIPPNGVEEDDEDIEEYLLTPKSVGLPSPASSAWTVTGGLDSPLLQGVSPFKPRWLGLKEGSREREKRLEIHAGSTKAGWTFDPSRWVQRGRDVGRAVVVGKRVTGPFWKRFTWDLVVVFWPPVLVLWVITLRIMS